jgi:site-specific recombinase XerC
MSQAVVVIESKTVLVATGDGMLVPRVIAAAGDQAARRFLEFFAATIRNKNTRMAYYRAAARFFACCDQHHIGEIADIEPLHVAAYVEALGQDFEKPTVKQHLAAIRMLFDWLVTGQVVATHPAHSVRGPKHVVKTGKTTVLTGEQARELLDSIDTSTVVGMRDRALISVMTFAFARVGAVVAMRVEDYYPNGKRWWCGCMRKAASAMRCRRTTISKPISTLISRRPESATPARLRCSAPPLAAPGC